MFSLLHQSTPKLRSYDVAIEYNKEILIEVCGNIGEVGNECL